MNKRIQEHDSKIIFKTTLLSIIQTISSSQPLSKSSSRWSGSPEWWIANKSSGMPPTFVPVVWAITGETRCRHLDFDCGSTGVDGKDGEGDGKDGEGYGVEDDGGAHLSRDDTALALPLVDNPRAGAWTQTRQVQRTSNLVIMIMVIVMMMVMVMMMMMVMKVVLWWGWLGGNEPGLQGHKLA